MSCGDCPTGYANDGAKGCKLLPCWLVSVKFNLGFRKVAAPGTPGDTFYMGACAANAGCGSQFGLKAQTIRNQRGEIVAFGNCCSGENVIGSAGMHSYGPHAECAKMECTAANDECSYRGSSRRTSPHCKHPFVSRRSQKQQPPAPLLHVPNMRVTLFIINHRGDVYVSWRRCIDV